MISRRTGSDTGELLMNFAEAVMGPGHPRRPYASEQPQSTQGGSSSATNRKRVRGRAKNKYLTKHIKRGGGKPRIEILPGKTRPIGDWSQEWINELGIISKYYMPLFAHKWKDVDGDARTLLHEKVLADPESQQEPCQIELYKNTHYNEKKGWISLQAEENYERMCELQSEPPQEGSSPLTKQQIFDKVLGVRRSYNRGLGHRQVAPSSNAGGGYVNVEMDQLRRRVADVESQLEELCNSTQERMNAQQQEMDAQKARIDEQQRALEFLMSKFQNGP